MQFDNLALVLQIFTGQIVDNRQDFFWHGLATNCQGLRILHLCHHQGTGLFQCVYFDEINSDLNAEKDLLDFNITAFVITFWVTPVCEEWINPVGVKLWSLDKIYKITSP